MIEVNRVTKVTKGGRTLRFAAIVIVGNKKGMVGMGTGKAGEVSVAIQKAEQAAKKSVFGVKIVGTTIPHQQLGEHGASKVFLWPTKEGNGIIAGGATRAVLELAGYKDVTAKIHGSRNNGNVVRATINALNALRTKEEIAALRGKTAEQI
ncbi:MAG: 30S ribosomal protein S5 [Firmicutes bacterium]|nr:30S ribosomal protein S5 [Bacillota bacterium]